MSTSLRLLSLTRREAALRPSADLLVQEGAHARLARMGPGVAKEALS
ncbi:hypothetical protein V5F32_17095 [Xanthobacter oligotrophicus]|uniref:Uroporphyrinogen-III synthase n=1 Tax=Xanthobacter oligotrophicus TaxID=2607286 RepID=A0ABW7A0V2_9HYPH